MKYETSEKEGVVIITLRGKMTAGPHWEKLDSKIKELIRFGSHRMVIDLGDVELMDSRGLGFIIFTTRSLRNVGGDLILARVTNKIESVLVVTGGPFFRTYASVDEALKSLKATS